MYGLTIVDRASPAVEQLAALVRGSQIANRYIGAVAVLIRKNFKALDDERANTMGGKRTHFYAEASKGTTWEAEASGGTISVHATGIAQRLFGGTIKPVKGKWLAIPARAEAYGHSPRDFDDLEPRIGANAGALVQRVSQSFSMVKDQRKGNKGGQRSKPGAEQGGGVLFWLVKSVTQDPDETVLPDPDDMHLAGRLAVDDLIRRVLSSSAQTSPAEAT